jgi:hypothetical protein
MAQLVNVGPRSKPPEMTNRKAESCRSIPDKAKALAASRKGFMI